MAKRQYLLDEVTHDYADAVVTRREALRRLGLLGLSAAAASSLLAACGGDGADESDAGPDDTNARKPAPTPAPSAVEDVTFAGPRGDLFGAFAAAPKAKGAVLVIHEIFGVTEHIRSLPLRFAADGYTALAIDLLSEEGGTQAVADDTFGVLGAASEERLTTDMQAGLDELERREPDVGLAAVGFCFGGGMVWQLLAANEPRLAAAVPFYGTPPDDADCSGSKAAVLAIYGELDARVNGTREQAVAALEAADLTHEVRTFTGAGHGFFNDTSPGFNATAAAEAYPAVLDWFADHLG